MIPRWAVTGEFPAPLLVSEQEMKVGGVRMHETNYSVVPAPALRVAHLAGDAPALLVVVEMTVFALQRNSLGQRHAIAVDIDPSRSTMRAGVVPVLPGVAWMLRFAEVGQKRTRSPKRACNARFALGLRFQHCWRSSRRRLPR